MNNNTISGAESLIERLYRHAEQQPDRDAVAAGDLTLSYAQLVDAVNSQATQLSAKGITAGQVIGVSCMNDVQHLILCLAINQIGASSCTIATHETEEQRNASAQRCNASCIVGQEQAVTEPRNCTTIGDSWQPSATPSKDARFLFSTSGTTGEPKLVVHTSCDIVAQAHRHISSSHERFACLATMEHNFAKRHRLYCVAEGGTNVFVSGELTTLVSQCADLAVNVLHVSAFQAQELLAVEGIRSLSNIRLKLGGSHVTAPLRKSLRANITENLQAGYGTTETGAIAFTDPNDQDAGESVGRPLPGIEVRTVAPDRTALPNGERGELVIRCAGMFREYLGRQELTNERLLNGWFYTGDIGYLDKQKRIHLCGRSDDMFVFNSMNIYPQDIESQIRQFPGIVDVAVLPKISSVHGSIPVALVVFASQSKSKLHKLEKFVRERVGLRRPRQYVIVEEIPRNATGKILRQQISDLSVRSDQVRQAITQILETHARKHLSASVISEFATGDKDITLGDAHLDSLARMDLLVALELQFDTIITPHELSQFRSLGNVVARVLTPASREHEQPAAIQPVNNCDEDSNNYLIEFFKRIFHYCPTAAQLNKALMTLEHRLTPIDIASLNDAYNNGLLIPPTAATKFHQAVGDWLHTLKQMLRSSGKSTPEPFVFRRIAPTLTHFVGPGSSANKTLIICFAVAGSRMLMMPNGVLMQHTDSRRFDILVVAEPLNESYRLGVPSLGANLSEVIETLARLDLVSSYQNLRTLGCSAGCYPATIAGYRLGAELAINVGGRFHSERHPRKIFERIAMTWWAARKRPAPRVLMSFDQSNSRDRRYAKIIGKIANAGLIAVSSSGGPVGHSIFRELLARGELLPYLEGLVFADMNDPIVSDGVAAAAIKLPEGEIQLS